MNIHETRKNIALFAFAVVLIATLPHGEDNPPAVTKTAEHREWVREQCARPDLDETERTACKNYFGANK